MSNESELELMVKKDVEKMKDSTKFWLGICAIFCSGVIILTAVNHHHNRSMTKEANVHQEEMLLIESQMVGEVYNIGPRRGR